MFLGRAALFFRRRNNFFLLETVKFFRWVVGKEHNHRKRSWKMNEFNSPKVSWKGRGTVKSIAVIRRSLGEIWSRLDKRIVFLRNVSQNVLQQNTSKRVLFRDGVVGNISACHADARGSIPRRGAFILIHVSN